jgi:hypothetical protein
VGKNFDEARAERLARDTTFHIGGETFTYVGDMRPEDFQDAIQEWLLVTPVTPTKEVLPIIDRVIGNFLVSEEEHERWLALRQRKEEPITSGDMQDVLLFLIGVQTGRPTEAPSSSGGGRENGGVRSTERSSLPVVVSGDSETSR